MIVTLSTFCHWQECSLCEQRELLAANWQDQIDWVETLKPLLTIKIDPLYSVNWFGGWRLPSTDESKVNVNGLTGYWGPDKNGYYDYSSGYNIIISEIGYLFYESLGNIGQFTKDGEELKDGFGLMNTWPFENLQEFYWSSPNNVRAAVYYWSETRRSSDTGYAWIFGLQSGLQSSSWLGNDHHALAVHSAHVSVVSEPSTILLLSLGLASLGIYAHRSRERNRASNNGL